MHRHDCFTGPCTDISCAARGYSVFIVRMEDTQCESAEDTYANSWPMHNVPSDKQSGGGCMLATAIAECLAADCLQQKHHRAEDSIEELTAQLQSLCSYQA